MSHTTSYQKKQYIRSYIHYMKGALVEIKMPRNEREAHLLNEAYTRAKSKMNELGKEITILG